MSRIDGTEGDDVLDGTDESDTIFGYDGNDGLFGRAGDDFLHGMKGFDVILAGSGDDTIFVGSALNDDPIVTGEITLGDAGTDTLFVQGSGTTYDISGLRTGRELESLVFETKTAMTALQLSRFDSLEFSAAGPLGQPSIEATTGGIVDLRNAEVHGDVAIEVHLSSQGNFVLLSNTTGPALNVFGGASGDIVIGLATASSLGIAGGAGDDVLLGGDEADLVGGNGGADQVRGWRGMDVVYGGEGDDLVEGGPGRDWLLGEAGSDTLVGGLGGDQFILENPGGSGDVDAVTDFEIGNDTLMLRADGFGAIGPSLSSTEFRVGAAAADSNDFVIYNSQTGALYYDPNGSTAGGAVQIATLAPGLALSASDFAIV